MIQNKTLSERLGGSLIFFLKELYSKDFFYFRLHLSIYSHAQRMFCTRIEAVWRPQSAEKPKKTSLFIYNYKQSSQLSSEHQAIYTLWVKYSHMSNLLNLNGKQYRANMLFHGGIWIKTSEVNSFLSCTSVGIMKEHSKNNYVLWRNRGHKTHVLFLEFSHKYSEFSHNSILGLYLTNIMDSIFGTCLPYHGVNILSLLHIVQEKLRDSTALQFEFHSNL